MFSFRALDKEWCKIAKSCVLWGGAGKAHNTWEKRKIEQYKEASHQCWSPAPRGPGLKSIINRLLVINSQVLWMGVGKRVCLLGTTIPLSGSQEAPPTKKWGEIQIKSEPGTLPSFPPPPAVTPCNPTEANPSLFPVPSLTLLRVSLPAGSLQPCFHTHRSPNGSLPSNAFLNQKGQRALLYC